MKFDISVFFEQLSRKLVSFKSDKLKGTLHEQQYIFLIIFRSDVLRTKVFQTKVVEQIETHFVFNNFFFFQNRAVYEIMWKNAVEWSRHAHCMFDT